MSWSNPIVEVQSTYINRIAGKKRIVTAFKHFLPVT